MSKHNNSSKVKEKDKISCEKQPKSGLSQCLDKICKNKNKKSVAVLRLSGVIGSSGFLKQGLSLDSLEENFNKIKDIKKIKALVVQVNSPGGSPVQSELIYQRIRSIAEDKNIPVYTFAEDVAASGGYWLACAGDKIYASRSSIIGSIGVIASGFGFKKAIDKLGIERRIYTQGENKSILDPFIDTKASDIKIINEVQKDIHEFFKDVIRERRKGKIKTSDEVKIFSGKFWSGQKALSLGLIDEIGDMHTVIEKQFGKNIKFIHLNNQQSWLKRKLSLGSSKAFDLFAKGILTKMGIEI